MIGHFEFRDGRRAICLDRDARQLVVIEAKMYSTLSRGTRYAPEFDQAARNVACMAEVLARSGLEPEAMDRMAFVVVAPEEQVVRVNRPGFGGGSHL
ncbi:MAG TPA: hypothetical protein VGE02_04130 [Gemmatimonadales bacterium]